MKKSELKQIIRECINESNDEFEDSIWDAFDKSEFRGKFVTTNNGVTIYQNMTDNVDDLEKSVNKVLKSSLGIKRHVKMEKVGRPFKGRSQYHFTLR